MLVNAIQLRLWRGRLEKKLQTEGIRRVIRIGGWFLGGFLLSAGALAGEFSTISLGFLCAIPGGWPAVAAAAGGWAGYLWFWGTGAIEGGAWMLSALAASLCLGGREIAKRQVLMMPAVAAVIASGCGVLFLLRFGNGAPVGIYLLRVAMALLSALVFRLWMENRGSWVDWIAQGLFVLALAQVVPVRYLGLGYIAAGFLGATGAFPAAALAGLGLDLAMVTPVKMTGVLCLGFCLRLIPRQPRWFGMVAPAVAYLPVAALSGAWDAQPLPGLLVGGLLAGALPPKQQITKYVHRRGETAVAQVRLEQMALALRQLEQGLLLAPEPELDRQAVLDRSIHAACGSCPERRGCKAHLAVEQLPAGILEQPGLCDDDLPRGCRKSGKLLVELRRGQEQLRRMKGDRSRLAAYRTAAREQYGFLAEFLQELSDDLARRRDWRLPRFRVEVGLSTRSRREENGDNCIWFPGPGNRYFILLCDGMGTGSGAAAESRDAAGLLKQMLAAGLPAEYALRCLNSAAVLREMGGCTTVDLVELYLDTGRGAIYKWGAAPSYLLRSGQLRKIGTAGPPPGLSQQSRETVDRLSLGKGEVLILLSDGAGEGYLLRSAWTAPEAAPGELAAAILEQSGEDGDDATAVVVKLVPDHASTQ